MEWKKIFLITVLFLLFVFVSVEAGRDYFEYRTQAKEATMLQAQVSSLLQENAEVKEDIDYYSNWHNLEKELKSKFNYIREGEKVLIVVPD